MNDSEKVPEFIRNRSAFIQELIARGNSEEKAMSVLNNVLVQLYDQESKRLGTFAEIQKTVRRMLDALATTPDMLERFAGWRTIEDIFGKDFFDLDHGEGEKGDDK